MGHPTSLFLTTPDPNLRCAICLDIFCQPVSLLSCSHTFCFDCLASSVSSSKHPTCPECRAPIEDPSNVHKVRVIESTINNLPVRCKNAYIDDECNEDEYCPLECSWTGPLSQWAMHASKECKVEIISCKVCAHTCPRGQMKGHLGSVSCVEGAVRKRLLPMKLELESVKQSQTVLKANVKSLTRERDDTLSKLQEESDQNRMLVEQNAWLRHSKEAAKKASQIKVSRLKREKKELMGQIASLERSKKEDNRGNSKKRKRSAKSGSGSSMGSRVRAVSNANELEVHAIVG